MQIIEYKGAKKRLGLTRVGALCCLIFSAIFCTLGAVLVGERIAEPILGNNERPLVILLVGVGGILLAYVCVVCATLSDGWKTERIQFLISALLSVAACAAAAAAACNWP